MKKKVFNGVAIALIAVGLSRTHLSNAADSKDSDGAQILLSGLIVKQDNKIIRAMGHYEGRRYPYSTFKVALALMGFDAEILKSADNPRWPFEEAYEKNFQDWYTPAQGLKYNWRQAHTPASFMAYSVVWFSHQITERLGKEKFQRYVSALNYGNKDVSGTPGKDDGLLNSWLGTSLQISPQEQVEFLEKLLANDLTLSKEAQEKTKEIMDRQEAWNGWKLYGKMGGGGGRTGWFIGWIEKWVEEEKSHRRIVFAHYLNLEDISFLNAVKCDVAHQDSERPLGLIAKEILKGEIVNLLPKLAD